MDAPKDDWTLVELAVTSNGPTVIRGLTYKALSIAKRISLLERWLERLSMELADLEDQYHAEG